MAIEATTEQEHEATVAGYVFQLELATIKVKELEAAVRERDQRIAVLEADLSAEKSWCSDVYRTLGVQEGETIEGAARRVTYELAKLERDADRGGLEP